MSQNLEARIHGHQPRLPLVEVDPPLPDTTSSDHDTVTEVEWRLDEHTRMVGRMGIAAARARLQASGGHRSAESKGGARHDGTGRSPSRAA